MVRLARMWCWRGQGIEVESLMITIGMEQKARSRFSRPQKNFTLSQI